MCGAEMLHHFSCDGLMTLKVSERAPPGVEATIYLQGRGAPIARDLSREALTELLHTVDGLFALPRRPRENRMQHVVPCVDGRGLVATYLCNDVMRGITFADPAAPEAGVHLEGEELSQFVGVLSLLVGHRQASSFNDYTRLPPVADVPASASPTMRAMPARPRDPWIPLVTIALGPVAVLLFLFSVFQQGWVPARWQAEMADGAGGFIYAIVAGLIAASLAARSWKAWQSRSRSRSP